ncbi:hypothetical protein KFE98_15510 [bacterium SCSIO 12741]|nr:hypothetical protein KFE98_15510 [bacterium SCSIO 12741]
MKDLIVTDNAIDLAIEHLENMEGPELNNLFEKLSKEQPFVMGFVVGVGEGLENEEAAEDLFYLTMIIWHAIELSKNDSLSTLSEEDLKNLEEKMDGLFNEVLSFPEESEEEELNNMIGASTQAALASYLADEFFSEEYLNLSEDKIAKMFSCMLVLSEALAKA